MAEFKIFETSRFGKDLNQDFSGLREKIKKKLETYIYLQLRKNPYFGKNIKKLRDRKHDTWRYRLGDYRFFYEIDDKKKIVFMLTIDLRKEAY